MKLKDCKIGEVVADSYRIGHIVGFTSKYGMAEHHKRTNPENAVPLVQFAGEFEAIAIHQCNINIYKGGL